MKEHFENEEDIELDIDIDSEHGKPHKIIKRRFIGDESCCDDDSMPGPMRKHKIFMGKGGKGGRGRRFGMHKMKKHMQMKILKEDGKTVMFLSLPGLDKSTLSVKAKKRAVMIEADYLQDFHKSYGEKLSEKYRIPFTIDPDKIDAEYKTGILKLTFLGIEALDPAVDINVTHIED